MKFKTGIIGLGTVSAIHRRALEQLDEVELTAVCDIRQELRQEFPGIHFYSDYEDMLEHESLDAVHICLPHALHYEAARACARHEAAVLCEKPSTINAAQLKKMMALEAEFQFPLAICLQNRLNSTFVRMREMIDSGQHGKLLGIKAIAVWSRGMDYYEAAPWRARMALAGGGCMINQALHTLDQMQLLGGRILTVKGSICSLMHQEIEVEDTAAAHIEFANGVTGTFFGTVTYVKNSSIELQAVCEKGTFTIKDYGLWYAPAEKENDKELLVQDRRLAGEKTYYGASHMELIQAFYRNLAGQPDSWVSIQEEGQVILLVEAIRRSSLEQRTVFWKEMESDG